MGRISLTGIEGGCVCEVMRGVLRTRSPHFEQNPLEVWAPCTLLLEANRRFLDSVAANAATPVGMTVYFYRSE